MIRALITALLLTGCADADTPAFGEGEPPPAPELRPLGDAIDHRSTARLGDTAHLQQVALSDGLVWTAGTTRIDLLDLADPSTPVFLATEDSPAADLAADGPYVVVTSPYTQAAMALEWTGAEIQHRGFTSLDGLSGLALAADAVVVGVVGEGLRTLGRPNLAPLGALAGLPHPVDIDTSDTLAAVVDADEGLVLVDLSDPAEPRRLGTLPLEARPQAVAIEGGSAYVSAGREVVCVDVSDPDAPARIGSISTGGVALKLGLSGDLLAVANWIDTRVYDVTDPARPRLVATEPAHELSFSADLEGDLLAVGDWDALRAYTVDPSRGGPDLQVEDRITLAGDGDVTRSLVLRNAGDRALVGIADCDGVRLEPASFEVEATGASTLTVHATLTGEPAEALCRLETNDVDRTHTWVEFALNPVGLLPGDPAPPLELPDLSGTVRSLDDAEGEVVLVTIFSAICPACTPELTHVESEVYRPWRDRGLVALAVSSSAVGSVDAGFVQRYVEELGITMPVLLDPSAATYMDWWTAPGTLTAPYPREYIIDRDGTVAYVATDLDVPAIEAVLEDLL